MRGKQTHFFATKKDLGTIIKLVESSRTLKYVHFGWFEGLNPIVYHSFFDFEDFGINKRGQATNVDIMFMVMDKSSEFFVEAVPQIAGGIKYGVTSMLNGQAIIFSQSGFYDEHTLIAGRCTTASPDDSSIEIYNLFRKIIQKNSTQVGYARVCTDAMEFMKNGGRMVTMGIDSPREYDLKFQIP